MSDTPLMTFGRFKGQPIDIRTRRSASLHRETEDTAVLKYFFHNSKYHLAKIPLHSVKSVQGQRFSFGGSNNAKQNVLMKLRTKLINHAQVRFTFSEESPVELYELENINLEGTPVEKINDIIYSVEVIGPKGQKWSPRNAFGDLACAHRVLSTREMFLERVLLADYLIDQTRPLPFNETERSKALMSCLRQATDKDMNQPYYLISPFLGAANCTSEAFQHLDNTLWEKYTLFQKLAAKTLWRLPLSLETYLRLRGIPIEKNAHPKLNEELQDLLEDESLLRRANAIKSKQNP